MPKEIVLEFIKVLNNADIESMLTFISRDHVFIDSLGNKIFGKENMENAWNGYFHIFPDYKIDVKEIFEHNNTIIILGKASGTYKNIKTDDDKYYWRIPVAIKVLVDGKKILHWQVFADNSPVIDIIKAMKN